MYEIHTQITTVTTTKKIKIMSYSKNEINREFLIKVAGINGTGKKLNTLVGVSGLINLIGLELADKFINRAFNCLDDLCVCRLRRGLKVTFYRH